MQELFSNEFLEASLLRLNWVHGETDKSAFEFVKLRSVQDESHIFGMILASLEKRFNLGDYSYSRVGNLLQREGPSIKPKRIHFKKFRVGVPFKVNLKDYEDKPKGMIYKVE